MKKFFVILVNIIAIGFIFFAVEKKIYNDSKIEFYKHVVGAEPNKFGYLTKPLYGINLATYFSGDDNSFKGRKPDGLEYNANPITLFGCSYAHGQYLEPEQTFSYRLAHMLKRPVYNRAIPGKGLAKMYFQSENDIFYRDVPKSDTVIYLMIDDHYRRMKLSFIEVSDAYIHVTYSKKGDKLVKDDFSIPIKCLLNSTYINKLARKKWVHYYINNPKYADELTDEVLLYFIGTRKNLEEHWQNKINFIVIFYDSWLKHSGMLKEKLEKNNFKVIDIKELTNEDLFSEKYFSPKTIHPTAETWELLTPLIVNKAGLL